MFSILKKSKVAEVGAVYEGAVIALAQRAQEASFPSFKITRIYELFSCKYTY